MVEQAEDCADLIVMQKPRKEVILVSGTPYHCEHMNQEFSRVCAARVESQMYRLHKRDINVTVCDKLKTKINGWFILEARHSIGGSAVPHGRVTSALRSQLWNILNSALSSQASGKGAQWPNLLVFGHRHYYMAAENAWGDVLVLPAWQANGGKYGDMMCDGHTDLGLVKLTVGKTKEAGWQREKILFQAGVVPRLELR
jgi:hypothetical protein